MNIQLICVGKLKEKFFADAVREYEKRLSRFARVEIIELSDEKIPDTPSSAEEEKVRRTEGERILKRISDGAWVIAMCIEGETKSSEELSEHLKNAMLSGKSTVTFIIGGSLGLSPEVKKRADVCLSVSPMTFPHQLFRVMLMEQIYRAFKIMHGEAYHK